MKSALILKFIQTQSATFVSVKSGRSNLITLIFHSLFLNSYQEKEWSLNDIFIEMKNKAEIPINVSCSKSNIESIEELKTESIVPSREVVKAEREEELLKSFIK